MTDQELDELFQSIENLPRATPKRNLYAKLIQQQQDETISNKWSFLYATSLVGLIGLNLFFYTTYQSETAQVETEQYEDLNY